MTSMPIIDDRMVVLFRRTGKRRAANAADRRGEFAGRGARVLPSVARVVPQFNACAGKPNGTPCGEFPGMFCCSGICKFGPC